MVTSSYKMNGIVDQELEEDLMRFTTNYEESKVESNLIVQTERIQRNGDMQVDIMECTKSGGTEMVEDECPETSENSSSFECEDEDFDATGETEVLSNPHGYDDFAGFDEIFSIRKKKLTNHWRSFIRPLMWRCKWVELQIKKFETEAEKYDREVKKYSEQKMEKCRVEDLGSSEVFVRKKQRNERKDDLQGYMSRHNLFSYYENSKHEAIRHGGEKVNIDDDYPICLENGDDDNFLDNIFRKIDFLQSRVSKLKIRSDKITNENDEKFSRSDRLPVEDGDFYGSRLNNADPSSNNGGSVGAYIVSQLIAEYKLRECLVPGSGVIRACFADQTDNEDYGVLIDNPRMHEGGDELLRAIEDPTNPEVVSLGRF